jgi:hypothetical protein
MISSEITLIALCMSIPFNCPYRSVWTGDETLDLGDNCLYINKSQQY